jgi:phospholipase C
MTSRRDFLKQATLLSGALGGLPALPACLERALAIDPEPKSTYLNAEHVVILMQENRSFDHSFGSLRGVRGFNDPRTITLPGGLPVLAQADADGNRYVPFRLDIHGSKATWMSYLPHDRGDQVAAWNNGKHDQWLQAKKSGNREFAKLPLTLGYYDRKDIPFYYALADAFTICDQHFCSVMSCTTPNRLYLWTGTSRDPRRPESKARLRNSEIDHNAHADWTTFPERLEDHGITWKVYQNEIDIGTGLTGAQDSWLGNYGDNPLEYFSQYHCRFLPARRNYLNKLIPALEKEIKTARDRIEALPKRDPGIDKARAELLKKEKALEQVKQEQITFSAENFDKLSAQEQALFARGLVTNFADPDHRELTTLQYKDGDTNRSIDVPKGDVFHQFRQDAQNGKLPTVSWLVAPEAFSDHPSSAWFGAWYVSEALNILTSNPDLWKKTIFILTYDENDGYFDHIPPFIAPRSGQPETGAASDGLDTRLEHDHLGQPIGLGYRVPMIVASPWSRGGHVCSQVFDHTSVLQFLEVFLSKKLDKPIRETNISPWRRAICGDLTSAFQPHTGDLAAMPTAVERGPFLTGIHQAQFRQLPTGGRALTAEEIKVVQARPTSSNLLPRQEPGSRPSCPLPYELYLDGELDRTNKTFVVTMEAKKDVFGDRSAGAPFQVFAPGKHRKLGAKEEMEEGRLWSFAVEAGHRVQGNWPIDQFENGLYHLRAHGPNGFFRAFRGDLQAPPVRIACLYESADMGRKLTGKLVIVATHTGDSGRATLEITDNAYGSPRQTRKLEPGERARILLDLKRSSNWYDFTITESGSTTFSSRYAGRVETGEMGISDPQLGGQAPGE